MDVLWITGVGFGVVAGLCALGALLHGRVAEAMRSTPTSPVSSVDAEETVEVVGVVRCLDAIDRPEIVRDVAWYRFRVIEEWEERGSDGRAHTWESIQAEESEGRVFEVEDETGRIRVDPADADVDPEILSTRRQEPDGLPVSSRGGRVVARVEELVGLEEGQRVYVLGTPTREGGAWVLSARGGGPFRISTRPESQQLKGMADADPILWATALLSGALAALAFWARAQGY